MKIAGVNRIAVIIQLSREAFGAYKIEIVILTILGFLSGLLGAVSINALVPLFSFVINQQGGDDIISQTLEKFFLFFNIDFGIKYLLIFVALLFTLQAFVIILFTYISSKITLEYEEKNKSRLYANFLKANWGYLLKEKLGHLETVLTVNIRNSSAMLGQISGAIMNTLSMVIYILVAINISLYITLSALVLGLIVFLVTKPFIYKARMISYEVDLTNKDIAHHVNENILGMKTIKSMHVEDQVSGTGRDYFIKLKTLGLRFAVINAFTSIAMQPVSLIFICVIFAFSYKSPNFNLAALIAVVYLIRQIFSYFEQLQKRILNMSSFVPFVKKVLEYEKSAKEYVEKNKGAMPFHFNHTLEFKNIHFFYSKDRNILENLNFVINKGEMIGLIGHSGAGKTTIVDLLLRLFEPTKGKILIDGVDIDKISMSSWRKNVGYISQDIFLKNGTIAENIRFYNDAITAKDMEEAAKMANIYDFIQTLPNTFSTLIGERGVLLSAGQRQRVVIARVLARKPKILVMDEATSALDNESEVQIQKVIENLRGKITVFVVAHRLSTIINSDRLLVLDNGAIVEEGRPQELLKNKETYFYKMYNIRN